MTTSYLDNLEKAARWPTIRAARVRTADLRTKLKGAIQPEVEDTNVAVVVTGSVGRAEVTEGSDVDWFLLIDGPSNPKHAQLVAAVVKAVKDAGIKDVGSSGTFATMVPSHELVHHIAGTQDTNLNLTRRVLLLAESHPLVNPIVRDRVLHNILSRYIQHALTVPTRERALVPQFLVNDIVRYWRTMATDYASKVWERSNRGWAIRNIKLRFSRKMLFIWGLLASFAGELFPSEHLKAAKDDDEHRQLLARLILDQTEVTPLDLLARVCAHANVKSETVSNIFDSYEFFLQSMSDPSTRAQLEALGSEDASSNAVFANLRKRSGAFREGIDRLFFDEHPQLRTLIRKYGVF